MINLRGERKMKTSLNFKRGLALALACLAVGLISTKADITTFTDSASFMSNVAPDYYLENFAALSDTESSYSGAQTFNNSLTYSFGLTVIQSDTSVGTLYTKSDGSGGFVVSTFNDDDVMVLTLGSNITAIGGNFFSTDYDFNADPGAEITITLDTGEFITLTSGTDISSDEPFGGFISSDPISSITVSSSGSGHYPTLAKIVVGTSVPEPSTWVMLMLGAGSLGYFRFRGARRMAAATA